MEDESRYRVEEPEEEKEKKGLFRPLPETEKPVLSTKGKPEPIVKLLGISMREKRRDLLLLFLMPLLVGLIDASVYSEIMVLHIEPLIVYTFVIPLISAIPVGLVVGRTSQSLIAALLTAVFFVVFLVLFLTTPAIAWPAFDIGQFFLSGLVIASVYFLLVVLASLMGALIGAVLREFF